MDAHSPSQLSLSGASIALPADLHNKHNALARTLKPEYFSVNPVEYGDITDEMRRLACPNLLWQSLAGTSLAEPKCISYSPTEDRSREFVALTANEDDLLVHNPQAFNAAVRGKTMQANQAGADGGALAAERAVMHANQQKAERQEVYLERTLRPWHDLLGRFKNAADHPGWSVMGDEISMRINFETFRTIILGNMLQVIGAQRGWTDEQADFATRTIEARMFIDRKRNQHIAYFAGLVAMMSVYLERKMAVYEGGIHQSARTGKEVNEQGRQ